MTAGAVTHLVDLHDQGTGNATVRVCSHIEHQCTHLRILVGVLLSCGGGGGGGGNCVICARGGDERRVQEEGKKKHCVRVREEERERSRVVETNRLTKGRKKFVLTCNWTPLAAN
jgi:hypothetical protein